MKVVVIGTEKRIFEDGNPVQARIAGYGALVEELHIICFTRRGYAEKKIAPNVYAYPTNSYSKFFWIFDAYFLYKKVLSKEIDLVSAQDPFESGLAGFFLAKKLKAKLHLQIHTDFLSSYFTKGSLLNSVRVLIARVLLPQADAIRVVSERIKSSIAEARIKLKREPFVLPVYVPGISQAGNSGFLQKKYPLFQKCILMVSRLEREKNISLGISAFAKINLLCKDAALVIVGDGSLKERLKREVRLQGISSKVFFEGWQENLNDYYQSAAIFLSTSNYEGYGMSLVEAALSGLPIVTTDVGIVGNLYKRDWGYVFPVGDEGELRSILAKALGNPEKAAEQAKIAKMSMEKSLISWERYLELYKLSWQKCF